MNYLIIFLWIWLIGFIGALLLILKDYKSSKEDVYLPEFLVDMLWCFVGWPVIIHYIIEYFIIGIFKLVGISVDLKKIKIFKGKTNGT